MTDGSHFPSLSQEPHLDTSCCMDEPIDVAPNYNNAWMADNSTELPLPTPLPVRWFWPRLTSNHPHNNLAAPGKRYAENLHLDTRPTRRAKL